MERFTGMESFYWGSLDTEAVLSQMKKIWFVDVRVVGDAPCDTPPFILTRIETR